MLRILCVGFVLLGTQAHAGEELQCQPAASPYQSSSLEPAFRLYENLQAQGHLVDPQSAPTPVKTIGEKRAEKTCLELRKKYLGEFQCQVKNLPIFAGSARGLIGGPENPGASPSPTPRPKVPGILPRPPKPALFGQFGLAAKGCANSGQASREERLLYTRSYGAGSAPQVDNCTQTIDASPRFEVRSLLTLYKEYDMSKLGKGKPMPYDPSKKYLFTVEKNFVYDPKAGSKLSMVSIFGEKLECVAPGADSFDLANKKNVEYQRCTMNGKPLRDKSGKTVEKLRFDQLAAVEQGRFSVREVVDLPPPWNPKVGLDADAPDDDQIIPSKKN